MQDFHDFVAHLLSRPGMEVAIQQSGEHMRDETVEDIITVDGIRAFKGPDGVPFLSGGQHSELRLLWCLCRFLQSISQQNCWEGHLCGFYHPLLSPVTARYVV